MLHGSHQDVLDSQFQIRFSGNDGDGAARLTAGTNLANARRRIVPSTKPPWPPGVSMKSVS